jgi:hypothetical protein
VLVDGHLEIQSSELTQVAVRVAVLSPGVGWGWGQKATGVTGVAASMTLSHSIGCYMCGGACSCSQPCGDSHEGDQRLQLITAYMAQYVAVLSLVGTVKGQGEGKEALLFDKSAAVMTAACRACPCMSTHPSIQQPIRMAADGHNS